MRVALTDRAGAIVGYALVDASDMPLVAGYSWTLSEGYAASAKRDGTRWRTIKMHRLIMGLEWGDRRVVDHKNRNGLDNRRENLRVGSHALNHQNRATSGNANGRSRFRGVSRRSSGKWRAYVTVDGKRRYLGDHATEEAAAAVAATARREIMPWAREEP